jgi:hypothetical protein
MFLARMGILAKLSRILKVDCIELTGAYFIERGTKIAAFGINC